MLSLGEEKEEEKKGTRVDVSLFAIERDWNEEDPSLFSIPILSMAVMFLVIKTTLKSSDNPPRCRYTSSKTR